MKSSSLLLLFLLTASFSYCQVVVGNVDINQDENVKIIEVMIVEWTLKKHVNVFIDYGQKSNFRAERMNNNSKDQIINDPVSGKEKVFISTGAVLNFMEANKWEHYHSLVRTESNNSIFYYYFRKKR